MILLRRSAFPNFGIVTGAESSYSIGMAWRIHDCVVRGEIDNRIKGIVSGRIWLAGIQDPIRLKLTGNACRDLAGCYLQFSNRRKLVPASTGERLNESQTGRIGDLTASRKVRVFDESVEEALRMLRNGGKPKEHMANCLYLEWFSEQNGRVVLESTDFELDISDPLWRLSEEEEAKRSQEVSEGFDGFHHKIKKALGNPRH